jgi:hypothetical protein
MLIQDHKTLSKIVFLVCLNYFGWYIQDSAQASECNTVFDCAKQMVDLANELKSENVLLTKRVNALEQLQNPPKEIVNTEVVNHSRPSNPQENRDLDEVEFTPSGRYQIIIVSGTLHGFQTENEVSIEVGHKSYDVKVFLNIPGHHMTFTKVLVTNLEPKRQILKIKSQKNALWDGNDHVNVNIQDFKTQTAK